MPSSAGCGGAANTCNRCVWPPWSQQDAMLQPNYKQPPAMAPGKSQKLVQARTRGTRSEETVTSRMRRPTAGRWENCASIVTVWDTIQLHALTWRGSDPRSTTRDNQHWWVRSRGWTTGKLRQTATHQTKAVRWAEWLATGFGPGSRILLGKTGHTQVEDERKKS